jgi:hypothetical protein
MAETKRIRGNPGTEPTVPARPDVVAPTPTERVGSLVDEQGKIYVQSGTLKIRLDEASFARLRSPTPTRQVMRPERRESIAVPPSLVPAIEAARKYRETELRKPGVISVRAGYKFINGQITQMPCIVVAVDRKRADVPRAERIPRMLDNIPTDVTVADPYERLSAVRGSEAAVLVERRRPRLLIEEFQPDTTEAEFLEAVPLITYEPPPDGNLDPVTGAMTIVCHVSPDAGWSVLQPFLTATAQKLQLGMYDFTAPHIYQTARSLLRDSQITWQQTLGPNESLPGEEDVDSTKAGDLTEKQIVRGLKRAASDRFESAFAHTGAGKTFASAYHIKVAVRDNKSFWLSSGNWQSSNQPDINFLDADADRKLIPRYNREWHVVVDNPALAKRFERYLEFDFETASSEPEAAELPAALPELAMAADEFLEEERAAIDLEVFAPQKFVFTKQKPLTVQPILTPDNYLQIVLGFLRENPKKRLYFQNQSLNPIKSPTPEFAELMQLLADYSNDQDLDVRLIFRNIGPVRKKLESLQAAGFEMKRVRMQAGCHTKGIIVDSEAVLIGSHNFTNQGVQVNRDASLLIRHSGIAQYYERIFLHDWEKLARSTIREEAVPIPVGIGGHEATLISGLGETVRIPWSSYEDE